MAFEERLLLLKALAQKEYDSFLQNVSFANEPLETAQRIVLMNEALNLIKTDTITDPYQVELLLYNDTPITDFTDYTVSPDWEITPAVHKELTQFVYVRMEELCELQGDYDGLPACTKERIDAFTDNVNVVIDYLNSQYGEQEQDNDMER